LQVEYLFASRSILCNYFCHADAAKLEATLKGVTKGHTIAMEELQAQLQKYLTENTHLEEQLKDQERQNYQKQKEVDDLCQAAVDFEDQYRGFNEVLYHFQKTLLGNLGSPCFAVCDDILC
jgi:septal ring factor EnvC (AmiA/AmiB activator)